MILVILGVCVVLVLTGLICSTFNCDTDICIGIAGFGGVGAFFSVLAIISLLISTSFSKTVDDKIAMYTEENAKIESQIEAAVEKYMEYESDTFGAASSESEITLVSLYPELKSDTLIASQIDIYTKNNKKIVELKESKINAGVVRWWLYFGK